MKKILAFAMAAAMTLSLAACGGNGGSASSNKGGASASNPGSVSGSQGGSSADASTPASFTTVEAGKLHMSTNAEFPPYEMLDDAGNPIGIDVEVAQAIANKLGLELVVDDMGFDAALLAVQNGQSDIAMAGITVSEDRLAKMDFTDSYATGVQVVIVKEGSDVTMDNLGEKMIGTQMGTTGYIYASDTPDNGGYGEDHVIGYETGAVAVQALVNGQVDAVIIDNLPAQSYVEANAAAGLTILEGTWVEEDYAIALQKGNTELMAAVNGALNELKADGTFQGIVDKYITAD
ncbi:MAG: transporter substrate-binding domain-containing protein [Lawsonibacter sp.]|nr:transporter substrate-binding domain-containing protein [Lawsonibacter sp.]